MAREGNGSPSGPIIAGPGCPAVAAAGTSLAVRERSLRFRFPDREVDAAAGTTVFVPAGSPHTYRVTEPSRYLTFLTPRLDRLITRLRSLPDGSDPRPTLAEFDTVLVD